MVIREQIGETAQGVKLFRHYSNEGKYLIQQETGIRYEEAVDVEGAGFTYIESTVTIPQRSSSSSAAE